MSLKLPLQSKAIRPKFQNKKAIFGDDDDDEEHVQDELVVGIEDNKLKEAKPKEKKKLLSITPIPNDDWRKVAKHKKELYIPAQALQHQQQQQQGQIEEEKVVSYGLQIQKKTENDIEETTTITTIQEEDQVMTEDSNKTEEVENTKTLEERAIEAIIKDSLGENDDSEDKGPKRVIHVDETLAFRDDIKNRPDETTMEDYENIPVEEFGAALLRGLGWNEGEGIGRNRKAAPAPSAQPVKQRDALLGLGAKPEDVSKEKKFAHKRAAYTFKDTSLFKKIAKKKLNDKEDDDNDDEREYRRSGSNSSRAGGSSSSRESSRSSRHDDDRHSSSRDRHDSRDRRDRHRSDRDRKRSRSRSSERHRTKSSSSSSSRSHRRRSRSRSPDRYNSSSSSSSKRRK